MSMFSEEELFIRKVRRRYDEDSNLIEARPVSAMLGIVVTFKTCFSEQFIVPLPQAGQSTVHRVSGYASLVCKPARIPLITWNAL